jgi:flagellar basal-body rod modification protein FlgD
MTTPVSQLAGSSAYTATEAPSRNDQLDKDAFLKLLVAQLRYQDPLNPADPQDFMAQTAQFHSVEKLEELTELSTASNRAQQLAAASSLVGRTVSWYGEDGQIRSGTVLAGLPSPDSASLLVGDEEVPLDAVLRIT